MIKIGQSAANDLFIIDLGPTTRMGKFVGLKWVG